jgi:hypothetical protein
VTLNSGFFWIEVAIFLAIMRLAVANLYYQWAAYESCGKSSHEWGDKDENDKLSPVEPIRSFQIEHLTGKDDRLINQRQP